VVVVNRRDPTRWGSLSTMGQGKVSYRLDAPAVAPDWLQAQGYHLLVFATLADAVRCGRQFTMRETLAVFAAEAEGDVTPLPPSATAWSVAHRGPLSILTPESWGWPEGTRMVRQVTLRRRIPTAEVWRVSAGVPLVGVEGG
jgi:hypothetical protein